MNATCSVVGQLVCTALVAVRTEEVKVVEADENFKSVNRLTTSKGKIPRGPKRMVSVPPNYVESINW